MSVFLVMSTKISSSVLFHVRKHWIVVTSAMGRVESAVKVDSMLPVLKNVTAIWLVVISAPSPALQAVLLVDRNATIIVITVIALSYVMSRVLLAVSHASGNVGTMPVRLNVVSHVIGQDVTILALRLSSVVILVLACAGKTALNSVVFAMETK